MKVSETSLPGTLIIEPDVYGDQRGFFMETWNRRRYAEIGIDVDFVQTNLSKSQGGVLRGLHYQWPAPQGKLIYVLEGSVWDVAVDIRSGSPTFAQWVGVELSAENQRQFWVPPGFAHGFCVTTESALFAYHCTSLYDAQADRAVAWNDPDVGIDWPLADPQLSDKDASAQPLSKIDRALLPHLTP